MKLKFLFLTFFISGNLFSMTPFQYILIRNMLNSKRPDLILKTAGVTGCLSIGAFVLYSYFFPGRAGHYECSKDC